MTKWLFNTCLVGVCYNFIMKKVNALTWGALLLAFYVIILLIPRFIPGAEIFLMLLAPLFCALYTLRNKWRETFIFVGATLITCLLIDPFNALLLILPVLISGLFYGFLIKRKYDNLKTIYIMTFVQTGLFLLSALIIKWLYQIDIINVLMDLFKLSSIENQKYACPLLLIYSLAEATLMHYVIKNEAVKFKIEFRVFESIDISYIILALVTLILTCIQPTDSILTLVFGLLFIMFEVPIIYYFIIINRDKKKLLLVLLCISVLVITIPLLYFLPQDKLILTISALGSAYFIGGIYYFFKINHNKRYFK